MFDEKKAKDLIYINFSEFMKQLDAKSSDKIWINAQVSYAHNIGILTDNEFKMMTESIKEKNVN